MYRWHLAVISAEANKLRRASFPSVETGAQNANSQGILVLMASAFVCTELTFSTCAVVFPQPSVFSSGDRLTSNSPKPQDSGTFLVITECQCAAISFASALSLFAPLLQFFLKIFLELFIVVIKLREGADDIICFK